MLEVQRDDCTLECNYIYNHTIDNILQIIIDSNELDDSGYLQFFTGTDDIIVIDSGTRYNYTIDPDNSSYFVRYDIDGRGNSQIIMNFSVKN